MKQVSLNLAVPANYQPSLFYVHLGVQEIIEAALAGIVSDDFYRLRISGSERTGKTHLACKLQELANKAGVFARIFSGTDLALLAQEAKMPEFERNSLLLVDDADPLYDQSLAGFFVAWYESVRQLDAKLILISKPTDKLMDDSVNSRLKSAGEMLIRHPGDLDMQQVIKSMAKQRGIDLSTRSVEFLTKRIPFSVQAVEVILDRLLDHSQRSAQAISYSMLATVL